MESEGYEKRVKKNSRPFRNWTHLLSRVEQDLWWAKRGFGQEQTSGAGGVGQPVHGSTSQNY